MLHPLVPTLSIAALNKLPKDDYLEAVRPVFEEIDDPWIAERCWVSAPFRDVDSLHKAMVDAVDRACTQEQLELLRQQPSLENRRDGLYFRRFSPEQQSEMRELTKRYEQQFGYPFVCCCRVMSPVEIETSLKRRLDNPPQLERITAMAELGRIARERLKSLFSDAPVMVANSHRPEQRLAANG